MKLRRELKDGTKALHYPIIALIGLVVVAVMILLKVMGFGSQAAFFGPTHATTHAKDMSDITRAASAVQQVGSPEKQQTREQVSQRGLNPSDNNATTTTGSASSTGSGDNSLLSGVFGQDTTASTAQPNPQGKGTGSDGIDSVNIALRTAEEPVKGGAVNSTGKPVLHEGGLTTVNDGGQSLDSISSGNPHQRTQSKNPNTNASFSGRPESGTYFDFRTPEAAQSSTAKNGKAPQNQEAGVSRLKPIIHGLPPGTLFPVYVITKIETSKESLASPVEFAIAAPITFNHRYQIPWGTHLLGRVTNSFRNRIAFDISNILYPDGRMLPINGEVLGEDLALGVPAYYHAMPLTAQAAPYIADFMTAYIQTVEQQNTANVSLNVGGNSVNYGGAQSDPRTAAMESAGKLLAEITNDQVKKVEELNAPYLFLQPYTLCYVKLVDGVDLSPIYGVEADPIPAMRPPKEPSTGAQRTSGGNENLGGQNQPGAEGTAGNGNANQTDAATLAALQNQQTQPATTGTATKNDDTSSFFGDNK